MWITAAAVAALAMVGLLAVLGSRLNELLTAEPKVGEPRDTVDKD